MPRPGFSFLMQMKTEHKKNKQYGAGQKISSFYGSHDASIFSQSFFISSYVIAAGFVDEYAVRSSLRKPRSMESHSSRGRCLRSVSIKVVLSPSLVAISDAIC